jgi:hypothetical protein
MTRSPSSAKRHASTWHLWIAVVAILVAVGVASHGMRSAHLWWDEHFTIQVIGARPYGPLTLEHLTTMIGSDAGYHTPTFYALLAGWSLLLGDTQFGLRLFPLLMGAIALACIYRAGVWLGGRRLGLAALCALAGAGFFLDQMTELRPYMLFALLGGIAPALYWRLINRPMRPRTFWMFVICGIALIYTHYYAALVIAIIGLYHLLFAPKNRQWWQVLGAAVLVIVAFLPWLPAPLSVMGNEAGGWRFGVMRLPEAVQTLGLGLSNNVLPFLVAILFGAWAAWRTASGRFMVFISFGFIVLMLAANQVVPVLATWRYGIPAWSFAALLAAYGIVWLVDQMHWRRIVAGIMLVWWGSAVLALWGTHDYHNMMFGSALVPFFRPNLTLYDATSTIGRNAVPDTDVVLYDAPLNPWGASGSFEYYTRDWNFPRTQTDWLPGKTQPEFHQTLTDYTRDALRVWWLYETQPDPDYHHFAFDEVMTEQKWDYCGALYTAEDMQAELYTRHSMCCAPSQQPLAHFGEAGVALDSWDILDQSRDEITLITSWQVPAAVPSNVYSIGWYLFDENNQFVLQYDKPLPMEAHRCLESPLNVAALTPGTYHLMVAVYDVSTGKRLASTSADNSLSPNLVPLGDVRVGD